VKKPQNCGFVVVTTNACMIHTLIEKGVHPVLYLKTTKYKGSLLKCQKLEKDERDYSTLTLTDGQDTMVKRMKDHGKRYEVVVTPVELKFEQPKPKTKKPIYRDKLGRVLGKDDIVSAAFIKKKEKWRRFSYTHPHECNTVVGVIVTAGWPAGKMRIKEFGTGELITAKQENCIKLTGDVENAVLKYKLSV
jgi:hypothetical protein